MKNNVKSAKSSELHDKSTPPKTWNQSYKIPPDSSYIGISLSGRSSHFSYILVVHLNISVVYILSLNKDTRYKKLVFGGITPKKSDQECHQPSFGKCAEYWRFGTPHSARLLLLR